MPKRTIKEIIAAPMVNMGGIFLRQPLPHRKVDQIDPFLLIHHGALPVKKGKSQSEAGVGPHPHRGFSPVTFVFKGEVQHQDSLGNNAIVKEGGTQWMHSGKGIIHSERPSKNMVENGGENEIIQFWVNSPAKHKMEEPYYLPLSDEDTPMVSLHNSKVFVVAGNFYGTQGPAKTYSPQTLLRSEAKKGDTLQIPLPTNYNTVIYILNGEIEVDNVLATDKDMLWFNNDGDEIELNIKSDSRFIVLSGEPIGEPVTSYGPFVMNTSDEINDAIDDYQNGKMGTLIEKFD